MAIPAALCQSVGVRVHNFSGVMTRCDVMQAGTLSGNPLAMTAGIKTLEILARPGTYEYLDKVRYSSAFTVFTLTERKLQRS